MPKISIVVPIYNVEKYINKCIDSILKQTFVDFELILVNDGSPDNCGAICDEYALKDCRVKVVHKKNGGLSDARNVGLDIAIGEYIGFVDSDDYIELDMYEKLLKSCLLNDSKIAMCGRYKVIGEQKIPFFTLNKCEVWDSKKAIEYLLTWRCIDSAAWDKLYKKDLFSNVRFPVGKYNEDIFIMTKIIDEADKIVHIGEPKYYYRYRENSITTESFSEKKLDLIEANKKVLDFIDAKYSDLNTKATAFNLKGIVYLLGLLQRKSDRIEFEASYNYLRKFISKNILIIIINPYIRTKIKIKAVLMIVGIYSYITERKINRFEQ